MIIRQLKLDHFGKFHHAQIELQSGINVICGANESGKSSGHAVIRAMVFGVEKLRGRGSGRDMYSRYAPWNGGGYSGRMVFEYQGQTWRIVRNFEKDASAFALINEQEGREYALTGEELETLIEGMNLSNFKNTISSGQLAACPDDEFGLRMQSYMANMATGADMSIDVSNALAYLKETRRKVVASVNKTEAARLRDRIERLQAEIEKQQGQEGQQDNSEENRERLQREISELELHAEQMIREDRRERMRAIQLIQENNDVATMYKEKKARLRELEAEIDDKDYQRSRQLVVTEYEVRQDKIEDILSRCNELKSQDNGGVMRMLALCFPLRVMGDLIWIMGGRLNLSTATRMIAGVVPIGVGIVLAILLMTVGGRQKRRIAHLMDEAEELEELQQEILDKYHIGDIAELKERDRNQHGRQEVVAGLLRELDELRERYERLQGPLAPYLEKYGESVSPESDAGQEEKRRIEVLRRQLADIHRQAEQREWRREQLQSKQSELSGLEEALEELQQDKKNVEEELRAIDLCERTIREITTQIHGTMGSRLADHVSEVFLAITDDDGRRLSVDEKFKIQVDVGRDLKQPQQFSAGTQDQIYFAVRMAVSAMLFDEPVPLILDDSFALYDDERLGHVLAWLTEQSAFSQILIFTCHHREEKWLREHGIAYHLVEL